MARISLSTGFSSVSALCWEGYQRVNALLVDKLLPLLGDDDIIWIHDYHLLPFACELRKRGVNNRIGFSCIFLFRRRKFLMRSLHIWRYLSKCVTLIYLVSRPKTIARLFWTVSQPRLGCPRIKISSTGMGKSVSHSGLSHRYRT